MPVPLRPPRPALTAADNGVVVLPYPRALGLLEASWTQIGGEPAFAMIVYGDRGTLLVHQPRMTHEGERGGGGHGQLVTPGGNRTLEPPPLAADERDGPTYFLSRIRAGLEVTGPCAAGVGRDVQEVIAAPLLASATGRRVRIPLAGEARV